MPEQIDSDVRQGAKAAAAAAAVGAAVGVARALAARADEAAQRRDEPDAEPEPRAEEREPEHEQEEPEDVQGDARQDVPEDEQEPEQESAHEPEPAHEPVQGAAPERLRSVVDRARAYLEELSGADVESVSALDQLDGGWRVTIEAVELRRIPDSTDVLATYEVQLDGDGDLVRYERRRRYPRSQSDHGSEA